MSRIMRHPRPRDHRLPRQPHRRGRRHPRFRRPGPRGGALGRLHRHARGGRAARRRQEALSAARACSRPSRTSTPCCKQALLGLRRRATRRGSTRMIELDGTDNKGRLGANALLAISLANAHARPPTMPSVAAVSSISAQRSAAARAGHARADDEHHQRRRARQQQPGHPGVHDPAGRRAELPRGAALRRGDLPHAEEAARTSGACRRRWATRAASRRTCESNEAALADHPAGHRQGRLQGRQGHLPGPRCGHLPSSSRTARYDLAAEKRRFSAAEFTRYLADLAANYPIITIEDGMGEADWDGWAHLTAALGEQDPAGGR